MNESAFIKNILPRIGDKIEDDIILETIAEGGMAVLYKCRNESLEAIRAVKLMKPHLGLDSERFISEARIGANLKHPNIVQIHKLGKCNDIPYIEMEYIDGPDLASLIKEKGKFPLSLTLVIAKNLCEAIKEAHNCTYTLYEKKRHGLIHRDIKPQNVLIGKDGSIKLADFGIAKPLDLVTHTQTSSVLGSAHYLSPEQLKKEELDFRTDIYSFGCVLYEMLSGKIAFNCDNITELVLAKINSSYVRLPKKFYPEKLNDLVYKCLQPDRNSRYSSIAEVVAIIDMLMAKHSISNSKAVVASFLHGEQIAEPEVIKKRSSNKKSIVFILASCLLAVAIVVSILTLRLEHKEGKTDSQVTPNTSYESATEKRDSSNGFANPVIQFEKEMTQKDTLKHNTVSHDIKVPLENINAHKKESASIVSKVASEAQKTNESIFTSADALNLYSKGSYLDCIEMIGRISNPNDTMHLVYLASLFSAGQQEKLKDIIYTRKVDDGYYFYLKGIMLKETGSYESALDFVLRSMSVRSLLGTNKKEQSFQLADIKYNMFLKKPTIENRIDMVANLLKYLANYCKESNDKYCEKLNSILSEFSK